MTKPNPENCKNWSSKCAYDCAQLQYTIQQNSSDNLPSYLQTAIKARVSSIGGQGLTSEKCFTTFLSFTGTHVLIIVVCVRVCVSSMPFTSTASLAGSRRDKSVPLTTASGNSRSTLFYLFRATYAKCSQFVSLWLHSICITWDTQKMEHLINLHFLIFMLKIASDLRPRGRGFESRVLGKFLAPMCLCHHSPSSISWYWPKGSDALA